MYMYFYQLAYGDSKVPKCFVGHQLHPQFWVLQQGKCLSYPPECMGGKGSPLRTVVNRGTPPPPPPFLKSLLYSLFRPKGMRKTIIFFSNFYGLMADNNCNVQTFGMLGTHSEPRSDISPLRIN